MGFAECIMDRVDSWYCVFISVFILHKKTLIKLERKQVLLVMLQISRKLMREIVSDFFDKMTETVS